MGDWAEEGQPGSPPSDCRAQGRHVPSHPNAHVGRSSENRPRGNVGAAVHRSFSLCLGLNSDPAWPPGVLALQTSDAPGGWSENRRVGGGGSDGGRERLLPSQPQFPHPDNKQSVCRKPSGRRPARTLCSGKLRGSAWVTACGAADGGARGEPSTPALPPPELKVWRVP